MCIGVYSLIINDLSVSQLLQRTLLAESQSSECYCLLMKVSCSCDRVHSPKDRHCGFDAKSRKQHDGNFTVYRHTGAVSQSRGYWLPRQYFKDATSSSGAAGPFQCPAYLEFHRGHVLGLGEISRLHMGRLRVLKIPTMLCARTNFPKSVAENVRHTCTLASLFHSSFSECQEGFLPSF